MNKDLYKETTNLRSKINLELYKELGYLLVNNPDIRFGQAVSCFFKNDTNQRYTEFESAMFNEEPALTYAKFCQNFKGEKNENQ